MWIANFKRFGKLKLISKKSNLLWRSSFGALSSLYIISPKAATRMMLPSLCLLR